MPRAHARARHGCSLLLLLLLAACLPGGSPPPPTRDPDLPPDPPKQTVVKGGLEVGWISREPRLTAPPDLSGPVEAGWPEPGRAVHWVAHVLNRGAETATMVPFAWRIDDQVAMTGVVDLVPGETEVLLPWTWTFARHRISFEIAPEPAAGDADADDNRVTVISHALALQYWIERGVYDWMLEDGRPGFERWAQNELAQWMAIFDDATFPSAPDGIADRIRIDEIRIMPDGSGYITSEMLEADLHWYVPTIRPTTSPFLHRGSSDLELRDQSIILHELMHQRGLTDLYAYYVRHGPPPGPEGRVNIVEHGRPVIGTFLMPVLSEGSLGQTVYNTPFRGLMGSDYRRPTAFSEHCVHGLNLWAGRRTPYSVDQWGNLLNLLGNRPHSGAYLWKMPAQTDLFFRDETGAAIANAAVDVFADTNWETYRQTFTAQPQVTLGMDARGAATLPATVFAGLPPTTSPPKSQVLIFGVRTAQARGFAFLPVYYLNMLYFQGQRDRGALEVSVRMHRY